MTAYLPLILTFCGVAVIPAIVAIVRIWGTQGSHGQRLTALEASQAKQDSDIHEMKTLLTSTRELIIANFAKLFTRIGAQDDIP